MAVHETTSPDEGRRTARKSTAGAELAQPVQVAAGNTGGNTGGSGPIEVTLMPSAAAPTDDQALWTAIRNRTDAIGFDRYAYLINETLCKPLQGDATAGASVPIGAFDPQAWQAYEAKQGVYGVLAYQVLKFATQAFLLTEGGVGISPPRSQPDAKPEDLIPDEALRLGRAISYTDAGAALEVYLKTQIGTVDAVALPYLKRVVDALVALSARQEGSPFCEQILAHRLTRPAMIELIWNYWMEQGALAQTMNAVMLRYQNRRRGRGDPLVSLALDPLRPLANLLWGRVQDEPQRLSVARRAHEYVYAYGFELTGKAVEDLAPVETRARFIQVFHNLLYRAAEFYRADANTTVRADAFQLLQALKDVHRVLAESANNQFDELKRQARAEMMIDQWLLARPEMREFLRGRAMVPHAEAWMGQAETMKQLQDWVPEVGIAHFRDLAITGEKLLLSVRYGDWSVQIQQEPAMNWARYWQAEVRAYLHSYEAATGVDLAAEVSATTRREDRYAQPSARLLRSRGAALPFGEAGGSFVAAELMDELARPVSAQRRLRGH